MGLVFNTRDAKMNENAVLVIQKEAWRLWLKVIFTGLTPVYHRSLLRENNWMVVVREGFPKRKQV